jgi:thienamycin biosynthesis protein ThnN
MNRSIFKLTDEYLQSIIRVHFNRESGAAYWLRKEKSLGIDTIRQIRSLDDLKRAYAFPNRGALDQYEHDLRTLPVSEFVPVSTQQNSSWIWASETGGTTGIPKRGTWGSAYWKDILTFSDEFLDLHGVPRNENWLFVGPTGPHTTGRLMVSIAENRKGMIFCIDMDPRIVRLYLAEGNDRGVARYVAHIWEQVEPIIRYQNVGVMFCTASLLELLPQHLDVGLFSKLKAVVHAGLAMSRDTHRHLRQEIFPNKPLVGIYGTSVSGISFQKPFEREDDYRVIYIPSQPHIVLEVIDDNGNPVDYGAEGDVRCFRFTADQVIPGFVERDRAVRVKPFGSAAQRYDWDWVGDPHSPANLSGQRMEGVY